MKNISNLWDNLKNYIHKHYGKETGKMLVHAGVITWAAASLSQIVAIIINDKVSSDQKKFLIPQEIAEGVLNILSFYVLTNSMNNISSKLVSTGKWSTQAIRDFVAKKAPKIKLGDMSVNLGKMFKENKEFHKNYDSFKGGADMIAASIGSVISCSIITPFIRNNIGAKSQKYSLQKQKNNLTSSNPYSNKASLKV